MSDFKTGNEGQTCKQMAPASAHYTGDQAQSAVPVSTMTTAEGRRGSNSSHICTEEDCGIGPSTADPKKTHVVTSEEITNTFESSEGEHHDPGQARHFLQGHETKKGKEKEGSAPRHQNKLGLFKRWSLRWSK